MFCEFWCEFGCFDGIFVWFVGDRVRDEGKYIYIYMFVLGCVLIVVL